MGDNTEEVQAILNSQRKCRDCKNVVNPFDPDAVLCCEAPQLLEVLDSLLGQNTIAYCNGVRDFKSACGHAARWFVPR